MQFRAPGVMRPSVAEYPAAAVKYITTGRVSFAFDGRTIRAWTTPPSGRRQCYVLDLSFGLPTGRTASLGVRRASPSAPASNCVIAAPVAAVDEALVIGSSRTFFHESLCEEGDGSSLLDERQSVVNRCQFL